MRTHLVYDLPLRLFHWLFAGLFVTAFFIVKTFDDDSLIFSYHMLAGLLLTFVVGLRLIWGVVGTKHSRFSGFALHPRGLVSYMTGLLTGDRKRWAGHNPASSWASILMFALALALGVTGFLMATGQKEALEDVHELLANGFLVVVLMHIAGVVVHTIRHQDGLGFSMVDGKKENSSPAETQIKTRPLIAVLFLGLVATFALHLAKNFDSQSRTLSLFGTRLELGEGPEQNEMGGDEDEAYDHD